MNLRYQLYCILRKWSCPFKKIDRVVPQKGKILDLGCGFGVFSMFLALSAPKRKVTGIDCEPNRINLAKKYANNTNINNCFFLNEDIINCNYKGTYDCILLVDVLYQLTAQEKTQVIENCRNSLDKDGLLIVKEMDSNPFWKLIWCHIQETIIARTIKLNNRRIEPLGAVELAAILRRGGFNVDITKIDKNYPYPHILLICRK